MLEAVEAQAAATKDHAEAIDNLAEELKDLRELLAGVVKKVNVAGLVGGLFKGSGKK